jgi:hypothetical protein
MSTSVTYRCENCGRQEEMAGEAPRTSDCCGAPWVAVDRLPACEMPATAEHSRLDAEDEPCDDGRSG